MVTRLMASTVLTISLVLAPAMEVHAQRFNVKLEGQVTELFSGDPIRGALVRILKAGQEDQQNVTRSDGRAPGLAAYKPSVRNMSWGHAIYAGEEACLSKVMDSVRRPHGYYKRRDRRNREEQR
ncbi:MAG: hypothetical protein IPI95_15345 [Flavobacteriales bacterium]|nr:hypothetical protein [Flavobacteriales bacterium]